MTLSPALPHEASRAEDITHHQLTWEGSSRAFKRRWEPALYGRHADRGRHRRGAAQGYDVRYVIDPNIIARATAAIEQWVPDATSSTSQARLAPVFGIEPAVHSEVHRTEYRLRGLDGSI